MNLEDMKTPEDITRLFEIAMTTNPIVKALHYSGEYNGLTEVQTLQMIVVAFVEIQDAKVMSICDALMQPLYKKT